MLLVAMSTTAKVNTDTVGIDQSNIKQIITNTTTNSKGKQVIKRYAVVACDTRLIERGEQSLCSCFLFTLRLINKYINYEKI